MGPSQDNSLDNAFHRHARICAMLSRTERLKRTLSCSTTDLATQPGRLDLGHIETIEQYAPLLRDVQALEELGNGTFPRT